MQQEHDKEEMTQAYPLFAWTFEAYERHERGLLWYTIAGLIVGALLVYSIATGNFLFGVLIIIATAILFLRHVQEPQSITCAIDHQKIGVGSKEYPFGKIELFWIIKNAVEEPILYIQEKGGIHGMLAIPLDGEDPEALRRHLQQYVVESLEHKFEPFFDTIFRTLKI
ncbi:hypothetical protein HYW94_01440 [Candidatus Uhrbacteria bacterium]|nr:hypothetical protein [Candidatus Uhrbacteria bacterium]